MWKKIALMAGFVVLVVFSGDILYLLTRSGFLANWGSVILPPFALGALWKLAVKASLDGRFKYVPPVLLSLIKVALFYLTVPDATLPGGILMLFTYTLVAYIFIGLGEKAVSRQG